MSPLSYHPITFRTVILYMLTFTLVAVFVLYVLFQARLLIEGPQIALIPQETVQNGRMVHLVGSAKNIVRITLNGRQIYTDKDGTFSEALVLENGYTVATLEAQDRYGRTTEATQTFVYGGSAEAFNTNAYGNQENSKESSS
jgi:hypothetical protein